MNERAKCCNAVEVNEIKRVVALIERLVQSQTALTVAISQLAAAVVDPEEPVSTVGLDGKPL